MAATAAASSASSRRLAGAPRAAGINKAGPRGCEAPLIAERTGPTRIPSHAGTAPALYVPGSAREGAAGSAPAPRLIPARGIVCRRSWARPPRGQNRSRSPALALHAGTTLAARPGVEGLLVSPDPCGHWAPCWGQPPLLFSRLPTVPEAEAAAAGVPEVPSRREDRIPQTRRNHRANALPKTRSLGAKAEATFRRRLGSCALRGSQRVCVCTGKTRSERVTECE